MLAPTLTTTPTLILTLTLAVTPARRTAADTDYAWGATAGATLTYVSSGATS